MSTLWHLIKFNFIFNRMRLGLLGLACLFIVGISYISNTDIQDIGQDILSYSSSLIFFIIVGKVSMKSNSMFDIKHQQSLPLNKGQIVFTKSLADLVHFFPTSFLWIYGLKLSFPEYHVVATFLIFHILLVMLNMLALNKRIDFARIQHASASFKNSILFLNKYLNLHLQGGVFFIIFTLIIISPMSSLAKEYALFLFVCTVLIVSYFSTLKMLKDESLSYFLPMRDIKRMGSKLLFIGLPIFAVFAFDDKSENGQISYVQGLREEVLKYKGKITKTNDLLSLSKGTRDNLDKYIRKNKTLPWQEHIMGGKLPHLAAGNGNIEVLDALIEKKPESVHMLGELKKRTPLFTALKACKLEAAQRLLKAGANLNHQDKDGNTPVLFAARSGCYGGVLLLKARGADLSLKNKKQQGLAKMVKKSGLKKFWDIERRREIASEKESL